MNILAVGAHYDDIELGCSGTLMNHIHQGHNVTMLVITDSAYKDANGVQVRESGIASLEGQKAAKIIGAKLICLNYKTFMVPFDEPLTRMIRHYIDELAIDVLYGHWVHDINRDHQNAGKSSLMAGRHIKRYLMFRSNFYDVDQQFRGNFYSDITSVMEKKIQVIKAHQSELERVRYKWLEFFKKEHENDGQRIGVEYAECFEVIRYLL